MALTIENIPVFAFIGNPIAIEIKETEANFKRFLYKLVLGANETEAFEARRKADNKAWLNVSALARYFFQRDAYPLPALTATSLEQYENSALLVKKLTFDLVSQYNTPVVENSQTANFFAIWGQIRYDKHPDNNIPFITSGSDVLNESYAFLTQSPVLKTIHPQNQEYLWVIRTQDIDFVAGFPPITLSEDLELRLKVTELDGSIETYYLPLTTIDLGKASLLDVSYTQLILPIYSTTQIRQYEIDLVVEGSNSQKYAVSQSRVYIPDYQYYPQKRVLGFVNSVGGFDVVWLRGESSTELEVEQMMGEQFVAPQYYLPEAPGYIAETAGKISVDAHTGYFEDFSQLEYLDELLLSKMVYEIAGLVLKPIRITGKKKARTTDDKTQVAGWKIEYEYLYPINAYNR